MTAENLQNLLQYPYRIAESELEALEELLSQFPYFQLGHLLVAKYAHDHESMLAPQKIRRAAIYAQDRRLLRRLIMLLPPAEDIQNSKNTPENLGQALKNSKSFFDLLPTIELDQEAEAYKPQAEKEHKTKVIELLKQPIETIWENQASETDALALFNAGKVEEAKAMYELLHTQNPNANPPYTARWTNLTSNLPAYTEVAKVEEIKPEEIKPEEIKEEEVKTEEVKTEEKVPEELKPEESKPEEVSTDAFFEGIVPDGQPDYIHFNEGRALGLYYDGKEKEAMDMYKKLMEIYPEKKAYYQEEVIMLVGKKNYKIYFDGYDLPAPKIEVQTLPEIPLEIVENTTDTTINSFFEDIETTPEIQNVSLSTLSEPAKEQLTEEEKPFFEAIPLEIPVEVEKIEIPQEQQQPTPIVELEKLEMPQAQTPEKVDEEAIFLTENQAVAFFNQGKLDLAIGIYDQLIIQNPIKKAYYESQIRVLRDTLQEALRPAKKPSIPAQNPDEEALSEDLAIRLFMQEKTEEAIEVYEKLIEYYPEKRTYFLKQIEVLKS